MHIISRIYSYTKNSKTKTALVPLDLFQHSNNENLDWKYENGYLVFYSTRYILAGEELTISYGKKSNSKLLTNYGFTMPLEENRKYNETKIENDVLTMETDYYEFSESDIEQKLQSLGQVSDSYNKNIHNAYIAWKGEVEILNRLLQGEKSCTYCEKEGCSVCKEYGCPCVNCKEYCEPWTKDRFDT